MIDNIAAETWLVNAEFGVLDKSHMGQVFASLFAHIVAQAAHSVILGIT